MEKNAAVILDACVLYPARLKDLLMELSGLAHQSNIFKAKWTKEIQDEWIRNVLEEEKKKGNSRVTPATLENTRKLMELAVPDCLVTEYEHRIGALSLPDPDDRHVLAAAIECGAKIIVTANLKDFPVSQLKHCSVIAKHPDDFLCELLADNEELGEKIFEEAIRNMKGRLNNPPYTWSELFAKLEASKIPKTVARLKMLIPEPEIIENGTKSDGQIELEK
ncbi:PIN domain-containing protein [bacterium]|nr:PIN domain-containing protein [bacterium]MBP9808130.1 PIN domain-containing protein [bacterium]